MQELSLIHIITCLQKFKIEKQTNQRQNQSQTGLERGKKTNANLISTINLLFFIYTVYLDKNFDLFMCTKLQIFVMIRISETPVIYGDLH